MKPLDLALSASKAMAEPGHLGVLLTIPKGSMPRGFPKGELLNEMKREGQIQRTYRFDPVKVIAWLCANKLIEMVRTGENVLSFREPTLDGITPPSSSPNPPRLD
jgi:hypothetical protein